MSNSDLPTPSNVTRGPGDDHRPKSGMERDLQMRIGRDGTWYYRGSPIERKALVNLFARILRREPDGTYWLVTPVERGQIEVEEAPFTAITLTVTGSGEKQVLRFMTNIEVEIAAGKANPIRMANGPDGRSPRPYILVRPGLEALIVRSVYYQLAELAVSRRIDGGEVLGVWSDGIFFPIDEIGGESASR